MSTPWQPDEGPLRLREDNVTTITLPVPQEDRTLLEKLGLRFSDAPAGAVTLTIPAGQGIMSLASHISDETLNEQRTQVLAHTLSRFFQVGEVLVCISTRFTLPNGGKLQPQWTSLSVLAQSPTAQAAPAAAGKRTMIPLATLMAEAELVAREEAEQAGDTLVIDAATIMSRIATFIETVTDAQGGIEGVLVWPGWQQALRRRPSKPGA